MSSQDNISQKLQQLNEMPPGIQFNSAATWNKLEDRLQQKPNGKKAWLRYAAIFLIVISGTVIYLRSGNRTKAIEVTKIDQNENHISSPSITTNDHNYTTEKTTIAEKTTTADQEKIVKRPYSDIDENDYVSEELSPIHLTTTITEITVPVTDPVIAAPVPIVIAPNTIAQKPKLRIVHLNDLYKPDITEIAKAETKKQEAKEEALETEALIVTPPKPFWKSKASQRITISLTDNP